MRVVATAFLASPGALAAGASGGTTIVPRGNIGFAGAAIDLLDATNFQGMEKPAGAATDLLDALNSECMEELSGSAAIVLGDNGERAVAAADVLLDASN